MINIVGIYFVQSFIVKINSGEFMNIIRLAVSNFCGRHRWWGYDIPPGACMFLCAQLGCLAIFPVHVADVWWRVVRVAWALSLLILALVLVLLLVSVLLVWFDPRYTDGHL